MTGSTAHLCEQALALLEVLSGSVAGGRNSQPPMPNHEVSVLLIGHFWFERLACQIGVDVLFEVPGMPLGVQVQGVNECDVGSEASLYVGVFGRSGGIVLASQVEIMVLAVGTCHIGDVPDGIGSCGIEEGTTRQGLEHYMLTNLQH